MNKEIEIPEGYEVRIEGNKVILEQKESEDEKTRKDLLNFLQSPFINENITDWKVAPWIAWIEKQKESDKAQLAVELIDKYIDENTANAHEMSDSFPDKKYYSGVDDTLSNIAGILIKVYTEGQKEKKNYRKLYEDIAKSEWFKKSYENKSLGDDDEQKPAEWKQENNKELTDFENAMMHIGCSFFGKNAGLDPNDTIAIKEQANMLLTLIQTPVKWSEEEYRMLDSIEKVIYSCIENKFGGYQVDYLKDLAFFIHTIQCKNHIEWSEEDEKKLSAVIFSLSRYGGEEHLKTKGYRYTQIADWLKSLRPQHHWKPSEEQMKHLVAAIEESNNNPVLESLYHALQKLL